MTPNDFCYWLQGWVELEGGKKPNLEQWLSIKAHLSLVFNKVTPDLETLLEQSDLSAFEEVEFPELKDLGLYDENDLPERLPEDDPTPSTLDGEMEKAFCAAVEDYDKLHPGVDSNPPPFKAPSRGIPQVSLEPEKICSNSEEGNDGLGRPRKLPKNVRNDK